MASTIRCQECTHILSWGLDISRDGRKEVYLFCGNSQCDLSAIARSPAESLVKARENLEIAYKEWRKQHKA